MIINSNFLGNRLKELGLNVINRQGIYSQTHQLFIHMPKAERDSFFKTANQLGISLNKKDKKLFNGSGIRIGVQEVTRFGWGVKEMDVIAEILFIVIQK